MMSLDQLAILRQTDRASQFTRTYGKPHGYAAHYDRIFTPLRDQPVKFLEIGAAGGEGVQMWLDYFDHPSSRIYGVDIVHDTNPHNTPCVGPEGISGPRDRYTFVAGDQGDPKFWERFITEQGGGFDICIDDGSHINTDIIVSFIALWPYVKPGGFFAIEDLATGYGGSPYFIKPNLPNHIDWLKGKVDWLHSGDSDIDSITFSRELVILRKAL